MSQQDSRGMWELHSTRLIQLLVTAVSNCVFGTAEINSTSDLHQSNASSLVAHNFDIFSLLITSTSKVCFMIVLWAIAPRLEE